MKIDVLYLAWNRYQFTLHTFGWLRAHTRWSLVNKLYVYDDGSDDGTYEFLRDAIHEIPVEHELRHGDFRSPPAVMNHYLATSDADLFAKIDSDIALPPGWLEHMSGVMEREPELELLGMEAGMIELAGRDGKRFDGVYRSEPCSHIGGVGLMRVNAFRTRPRIGERGRFGFTEWQERYEPVRAWIRPDLKCPQLDRLPFEPWQTLADEYVEKGWSRPWGKYDEQWMRPYWGWMVGDNE